MNTNAQTVSRYAAFGPFGSMVQSCAHCMRFRFPNLTIISVNVCTSAPRSATSLSSLALCAVYFFPGIAGPKLIALGRSLAVVLPAVGTGFT